MALTLDVVDGFDAVAAEWDALADELGVWPDLRPGFLLSWWDAFDGGAPHILVARDGERLVGVLPLVARGATLSSPTNWESSRWGMLAASTDAADALAAALFAGRARRVHLGFIDAEEPWLEGLRRAASRARYRLATRPLLRSPYVGIDTDWEMFRRRVSGDRLRELGRRRRRLAERGEVTLDVRDGTEGLDALLEEGFALEGSGWKAGRGTSISAREDARRFYTGLARWAAGRGLLRLAFLRVGGRAVAFDYCLETEDTHFLVKTGFDVEHRRWAPGLLLRHDMLERAFALGLRTYEFLGADDPWKAEWATSTRDLVAIDAYPPTAAGRVRWVARTRVRPVVARAKRALRGGSAR
jgi:CelD/BcsL family acetyltransferase involved in cellulose biosynthesis